MITGLEIENYKCFGRRVHVPLAPITVLVGPNSAGKTTIIRLLGALQQTYESQQPFCALLPKGERIDLGSVDSVFHQCRTAEGAMIGFRFSRDEGDHLPAFTFRIRMEATERQQFKMVVPRRFQFLTAPDEEVILDLECPDPLEEVGKMPYWHDDKDSEKPLFRIIGHECSSSPALWEEDFRLLRDRARKEQQQQDNEEERRRSLPPPDESKVYLIPCSRLDPDFRHFLLHEASLESFADRMAGEIRGDQQALSDGSFLPLRLKGLFDEESPMAELMPNRVCNSARYKLRTLFEQLDFY